MPAPLESELLESELKYRAETDAPLDALARATSLGPADLGPAHEAEDLDRYLDTSDRRLASAGWACRMRTRGDRTIVSLKGAGLHAPDAIMHRRPELEGPADASRDPADWPPSPARDFLVELASGEPLTERLTIAQRRVERPVSVAGHRVGLLSLDRARVLLHGRERGLLRVVELELDREALAGGLDPKPWEHALGDVPGLAPEPSSKLERALAIAEEGRA
jgi:inorganic triphosphatase YgiF